MFVLAATLPVLGGSCRSSSRSRSTQPERRCEPKPKLQPEHSCERSLLSRSLAVLYHPRLLLLLVRASERVTSE